MAHPQPSFDPGLTQQYTGALSRTINDDGQFNVHRRGARLHDFHPYLFLISTRLPVFVGLVLGAFIVTNLFFATIYMVLGPEHIKGVESSNLEGEFVNAFFFSAHTLTTVGYGNMYPVGVAANSISAIEALTGLMLFAIVTGLVFGRFSRPSARVGFSSHMLVAPYGDGLSLQFRIVNRRSNNLLELNARVMLMTVEWVEGQLRRKFRLLDLERDQVIFFPLTWTIVHPIGPDSPLYQKTAADLASMQAEILVFVKAFDETFGQTVNSRRSYRHSELVWGARFTPAFEIDPNGDLRLEMENVGSFERVELPQLVN
jgi:inward rectifier potassium channel